VRQLQEIIYKKEIDKNLKVCRNAITFRISARERIKLLVDEGVLSKLIPFWLE